MIAHLFHLLFICLCSIQCVHCVVENDIAEITVPLKFGESELQLSFPATHSDADIMARKFCTEKVMYNEKQLKECLDVVGSYLKSSVDKHIKGSSSNKKKSSIDDEDFEGNEDNEVGASLAPPKREFLTITLQIGYTVYEVEYNFEDQSAIDVASVFCKQNMEKLGITIASLQSCVDPVVAQLDTALEKHLIGKERAQELKKRRIASTSSHERVVTLDIGGVNYDLRVNQAIESVEESVIKFCRSKLVEFDLTLDSMKESCVDPICEYVNSIIVNVDV